MMVIYLQLKKKVSYVEFDTEESKGGERGF